MRKNKRVLTAVILGASLLLAGCGGLGGANSAAYIANEDEIAEAMEEMSDELGNLEMSMDGKIYTLPFTAGELMEEGWEFPEDILEKIDPFTALTEWNKCEMVKTDGEVEKDITGITMVNPEEEDVDPADAFLTSFSLDRYDQVKLILPKGITWASSIEEVKDAYGEPYKETETGSEETYISTVLRYYFDDNSHVFIGFETEDGKTKMTNLSMSYSY